MGVSAHVQIRSYYGRNIKGAFTALFIRSAHKRRFTVLTLPYTLFLSVFLSFHFFFFASSRAGRSFPLALVHRYDPGSDEGYIEFRDQSGHLSLDAIYARSLRGRGAITPLARLFLALGLPYLRIVTVSVRA